MDNVVEIPFPNTLHDVGEIADLKAFLDNEKTQFEVRFSLRTFYNVSLYDFELINVLGSGSFGKVVLARHNASQNIYAIKLLKKGHVVKGKQVVHALNEKKILESLHFPFTIYLDCFFHDNSYLYFTMPLIIGGEIFSHLRRSGRFDENLARFYGAQVLLGIEYLHYLDLAYRDLKPENILIDVLGYIKISDFGFCKKVVGRTWTLCGTPEYLAPEVIMSRGYSKSVDWWSYGVLLYEMCAGYPPFYAKDHLKLYEKIVQGKYKVASHFSSDLNSILNDLLQVDLTKRVGNLRGGVAEIKNHSWFRLTKWLDLLNYTEKPPFIPAVKEATDITNFDYFEDTDFVIHIAKEDVYAAHFTEF